MAQKMYSIARIVNVVELATALIVLILGIVFYCIPDTISDSLAGYTVKSAQHNGKIMLIVGAVTLPIMTLKYFLASKAQYSLNDGHSNIAPHIALAIIGAVTMDFLYLIAGTFGLTEEYQEKEKTEL